MQQNGFFFCRTYCPLNMFRAPLCPSSGAQELYRWLLPVVHGALVYRSLVWCGAQGMRPGCGMLLEQHPATRTHTLQLHTRPTTRVPKRHVPQAATIYITLELLMMGIMVPETCWADKKFCNKTRSVASIWPFISTSSKFFDVIRQLSRETCKVIYKALCVFT